DPEIPRAAALAARPSNDGLWRDVSACGPVENQKCVIEIDDEKTTDGVDGHRWFLAGDLRAGSLKNPFRSHIAVRHAVEDENAGQRQLTLRLYSPPFSPADGKIDFTVNAIYAHLVESGILIAHDLRAGSN